MENNNIKSFDTKNFTLLEPTEHEKDLDNYFDDILDVMSDIIKMTTYDKTKAEPAYPTEHMLYLNDTNSLIYHKMYKPAMKLIRKPFTCTLKFQIKFIKSGGPKPKSIIRINIHEFMDKLDTAQNNIEQFLKHHEETNYFNKKEALAYYDTASNMLWRGFREDTIVAIANILIKDDGESLERQVVEKCDRLEFLMNRLILVIDVNDKEGKLVHHDFRPQ